MGKYIIPANVKSMRKKLDYMKVIENDWVKYIDILYKMGGLCMYSQFIDIISIYRPSLSVKSKIAIASKILSELNKLDFIEYGKLGKNKYIILKYSAILLVKGDIKKVNCLQVNKINDEAFRVRLIKVEHYIKNGEILSLSTYSLYLREIVKMVIDLQAEDESSLEELLKLNDISEYSRYLKNIVNFDKSNAIELILNISNFFIKSRLRNHILGEETLYLKIFKKRDGNIVLHYIPVIYVIDSGKDMKYYKEKLDWLFYEMQNMPGNNVVNIRDVWHNSSELGSQNQTRIGYVMKIIGGNLESLQRKREEILNIEKKRAKITPLIDVGIIPTDITKYFNI